MLGGHDDRPVDSATKTVYMCLLTDLFHSKSIGARLARSLAPKVWDEIAHIPCKLSTCVTSQGHLIYSRWWKR